MVVCVHVYRFVYMCVCKSVCMLLYVCMVAWLYFVCL